MKGKGHKENASEARITYTKTPKKTPQRNKKPQGEAEKKNQKKKQAHKSSMLRVRPTLKRTVNWDQTGKSGQGGNRDPIKKTYKL